MTEFVAQNAQGRNRYKAPLPKTCPDFWYMVVQEKSCAILMLCNFMEQNAKKCAEYFPAEEGGTLNFEGDVTVTAKGKELVHILNLKFFTVEIYLSFRSLQQLCSFKEDRCYLTYLSHIISDLLNHT
ncbi:hypothetical protein KIN20_001802 [Parelaphostrongylus tenuis]|uniref:Tyrosine-protein phosphatase domain-containing protein n=1 Tax=Parelaphostrongylus tenuis TaxID=148309 RepID=A0AAD5MFL7_PARTN|nr:hypothetical protein KIN20_001802 [Parelaphostrongylus tenuis]